MVGGALVLGALQMALAAEPPLIERLEALSDADYDDLLDFVEGNALFTLYHEAGHMLVSQLDLPVLGQEEDAVDNLATISMLQSGDADMDHLLSQAMLGWFLSASDAYDDLVFHGEHDLDLQRGYRMLCLMVGSDPDAFGELAADLELPGDRVETCPADYDQAVAAWDGVTEAHRKPENGGGLRWIEVRHDPAPEDLAPFAELLKETELMEVVAQEMDDLYRLPAPVLFRSTACQEANAFWDPDAREVILCYELLGAFAELFLEVLAEDD